MIAGAVCLAADLAAVDRLHGGEQFVYLQLVGCERDGGLGFNPDGAGDDGGLGLFLDQALLCGEIDLAKGQKLGAKLG